MTLSEIHTQLVEYYELDTGAYISNHQGLIHLFDNYYVTKRSLKHIVEQRHKDNYDTDKAKNLFSDLFEIIQNNQFTIADNKDITKILIETRENRTVLAVAIIDKVQEKNIIVTAFYRSKKKLLKYLNNK